MRINSLLIAFLLLISTFDNSRAQNSKAVAVDGYFTNRDSVFVSEYLGPDNIISVIELQTDSAVQLLGDAGKKGLIIFKSSDPHGEKSAYFRRQENRLITKPVSYIVNGAEPENFKMNSIDPASIKSVNVYTPLGAAQKFGCEKNGGVVFIQTKIKD